MKNIWAKTILTSYRYLERLADAIDSMVESRGLYSRVMSGVSYSTNNIYNLADKLIELSERKVKLINIKVLTEKTLEKCGENSAKLLISRYIDEKKNAEIAEFYQLSLRTYFRRLSDAERRFEEVMAINGFGDEKLEKYLSGERWIMEIKNRIECMGSGQDFDVEERYLDKLAVS